MKFSMDRKYFYEKLSIVARAISVFSPLPALSGICIDVKEDKIILTGSDSNVSIRSTIVFSETNQLQIESTGSIVIESKYLLEIVRKMDSNRIEFELIDFTKIRLEGNNGKFELNGIQSSEYPEIDFQKPLTQITLSTETLKQIVSQTAFACSDKDKRPVLNGVNFNIVGNKLYCSGTDSYRLARKEIELETSQNINVTIPSKSLTEVVRSFSEEVKEVDLFIDYKKAQFIFDRVIIQTRLIDGTFPDVERIIPNKFIATMEVDAHEITNVVDRTNFIRNDKVHLVRMECSSLETHIKTNSSEIGNSDEVLTDCLYEGEDLRLSCNGTFLLEAIRALGAKRVKMEFSGLMKPIRITNTEDASTTMIIVPIRSYD